MKEISRRGTRVVLASILLLAGVAAQQAPKPYFPERGVWETRAAGQVGMDPARLDAAVKFAVASENPATKDLAVDLATTFGDQFQAILQPENTGDVCGRKLADTVPQNSPWLHSP